MATATQHDAIYSGIAIVIASMIWLYVSWLILLLGVKIAFLLQNPHYIKMRRRDSRLSNRLKETFSLTLAYKIDFRFYLGNKPWGLAIHLEELSPPLEPVREILGILEKTGILTCIEDSRTCYLPAKALEQLTLGEIIRAIRNASHSLHVEKDCVTIGAVNQLMDELDTSYHKILDGIPLRDIIVSQIGSETMNPRLDRRLVESNIGKRPAISNLKSQRMTLYMLIIVGFR